MATTASRVSTEPTLAVGPASGLNVDHADSARGVWRLAWDAFRMNWPALIGLGIVTFMVLFCFVGPLLYHTNQVQTNIGQADLSPSWAHPLGTDDAGYDVLGRLMAGGQSSLKVGFAAAALATCLGMCWGALAGYAGGIVDSLLMRTVDALLAIPPLFLLLFLASIVTLNLRTMILVVAVVAWLVPARLVRGEALSLRVREYVQAVKIMGGSNARVVFRHILPNSIGTIVVNGTFQVADAILLLASLSYLGLGIPPPAANWGGMLSQGLNYLYEGYWWLIYPAGACIVLTVVAINFIGDAVRDAMEVTLQQR
jgi:peptide/nickel transport system permease protein